MSVQVEYTFSIVLSYCYLRFPLLWEFLTRSYILEGCLREEKLQEEDEEGYDSKKIAKPMGVKYYSLHESI